MVGCVGEYLRRRWLADEEHTMKVCTDTELRKLEEQPGFETLLVHAVNYVSYLKALDCVLGVMNMESLLPGEYSCKIEIQRPCRAGIRGVGHAI